MKSGLSLLLQFRFAPVWRNEEVKAALGELNDTAQQQRRVHNSEIQSPVRALRRAKHSWAESFREVNAPEGGSRGTRSDW